MRVFFAVVVAATIVSSQPHGPAAMSGVVVTADGVGAPGVEVRATGADGHSLVASRTAADGRFKFSGVAPGRWLLSATAPGFLPATYGAFAYGQPGVPVRLEAGASVEGLNIVLERPASATGRVTDQDGEPVPAVVQAMAATWTGTREALSSIGTARTDREGRYELGGLVPGRYLLLATPLTGGPVVDEPPDVRALALQPAFYPGVSAPAHAAHVSVRAGDALAGLDIGLRAEPVASLEVTLTRGDRHPLGYISLIVLPRDVGDAGMQVDTSPSVRPLQAVRLPAGEYDVIGSALEAEADGRLARLWVATTVTLDGRTSVKMPLELGTGARLEGRLVFDGAASQVEGLPEIWLWPIEGTRPESILPFAGTLVLEDGGSFAISGIAPGQYLLQFGRDAASQVAGWSVKRVLLRGEDVADLPIDLHEGDLHTGVEVVLSNRPSELVGTITDAAGEARFDVTLVAFPVDSRYWRTGTRRIRFARPDTSGQYLIRGLPEGEYLLAAVSGALPEGPTDPQWLSGLAGAAVRVLVADGSRTVQDLRPGTGQGGSGQLAAPQVRERDEYAGGGHRHE